MTKGATSRERINGLSIANLRVPTNSGNHGKPGKSPKKVPCMEKSWNFEKP